MKPLTQNHFTIALIVLACVLGFFADRLGVSGQIVSVKFINVAMLLGTTFLVSFFTRGTQYDVLKEIFDEHNIAAALWLGLLALSISIVCTVVS